MKRTKEDGYQLLDIDPERALKHIRDDVENYYLQTNIPENVKRDILPALMTLNDGHLYRKQSTIEKAGLGLFCRTDITRGTLITYYDGIRVDPLLMQELQEVFGKEADSYAQGVETFNSSQTLVSNFRLKGHPATTQAMQESTLRLDSFDKLELVDPAQLGEMYNRCGAMQFANSTENGKAKAMNARILTIHNKERYTPKELQKNDEHPTPNEKLCLKYPDGVAVVLYALRDIPAGEEILLFYGLKYLKVQLIVFCAHCAEPAKFQCKQCKSAAYCSSACQKNQWLYGGHASDCFQ